MSQPLTASAEVVSTRLTDLLLLRILASSKGPPAAQAVRKCLNQYLKESLSTEQWNILLSITRTDGLLEPKALRLTQRGRKRALDCLALSELPPRSTWRIIESRYLTYRASGMNPKENPKSLTQDQLASRMLKTQLGLPISSNASLSDLLVAIVAKELGFPEETDARRLIRRVLCRQIQSDELLSSDILKKQLPRIMLKLKQGGAKGLRQKLIADWLNSDMNLENAVESNTILSSNDLDHRMTEESDFDLKEFADTVKAAARHCPSGRFGDRTVFINHVWHSLKNEPRFQVFDLTSFKAKLVEANAARYLDLVRADLVQAMNPEDIRESEIEDFHSIFNFIRID